MKSPELGCLNLKLDLPLKRISSNPRLLRWIIILLPVAKNTCIWTRTQCLNNSPELPMQLHGSLWWLYFFHLFKKIWQCLLPLAALFHMWQVILLLCMYLSNKTQTQPQFFVLIFISEQLIVALWENMELQLFPQWSIFATLMSNNIPLLSKGLPDFHSDFYSVLRVYFIRELRRKNQAHLAQMLPICN